MDENGTVKPGYELKGLNSGNSRTNMDKDPIVSKFHRAGLNDSADEEDTDINGNRNTSWITSMISEEKRKVEGKSMLNDEEDLHLSKATLNKCDALVKILADIIKLEFVIHQSWYIRSLHKSVLIQFEVETSGGNKNSAVIAADDDEDNIMAIWTIAFIKI